MRAAACLMVSALANAAFPLTGRSIRRPKRQWAPRRISALARQLDGGCLRGRPRSLCALVAVTTSPETSLPAMRFPEQLA